jgi:hypothetical protein
VFLFSPEATSEEILDITLFATKSTGPARERIPGAEAILALRAAWKSQDARWERLWANRPAYILANTRKKAA